MDKKEVFYHIGQRFNYGSSVYLLCSLGHAPNRSRVDIKHLVLLIDIEDGIRWNDPVVVDDCLNINKEEFNRILGKNVALFTPIK